MIYEFCFPVYHLKFCEIYQSEDVTNPIMKSFAAWLCAYQLKCHELNYMQHFGVVTQLVDFF